MTEQDEQGIERSEAEQVARHVTQQVARQALHHALMSQTHQRAAMSARKRARDLREQGYTDSRSRQGRDRRELEKRAEADQAKAQAEDTALRGTFSLIDRLWQDQDSAWAVRSAVQAAVRTIADEVDAGQVSGFGGINAEHRLDDVAATVPDDADAREQAERDRRRRQAEALKDFGSAQRSAPSETQG